MAKSPARFLRAECRVRFEWKPIVRANGGLAGGLLQSCESTVNSSDHSAKPCDSRRSVAMSQPFFVIHYASGSGGEEFMSKQEHRS